MAEVNWTAYGDFSQIITNVEPANDGLEVSSEVDNSTDKDLYADFELQAQFGVAPSAGGYVGAYLVQALNGADYADGADGAVVPPSTAWIGSFPVRAVVTAQKVTLRGIVIPPGKFKVVIQNKSGQAVSANTGQLYYRKYSEVIA